MNIDDLVHFTLKEWTRMSTAPTSVEVERAKSQVKASLLLSLDGTTAVAEDIGRQLVTTGRRFTPQQIESAIDAVTVDDMKRVAQKYLWDKDVGPVASLCWVVLIFLLHRLLLPPLVALMVFWITTAFATICRLSSSRRYFALQKIKVRT